MDINLDQFLKQSCELFELPSLMVSTYNKHNESIVENYSYDNNKSKIYKVGSLSKVLTAIGILLLVNENKIQLNQSVFTILNWSNFKFPKSIVEKLSIKNLLLHFSGLSRGQNYQENPKSDQIEKSVYNERKSLANTNINKFKYSNLGYIILGLVIEEIAKQSYSSFINDRIFIPLEMTDSGFGIPRKNITNPHGLKSFSKLKESPFEYKQIPLLNSPFASGDLHSTASDLINLTNCLLNNGAFNGKQIFDKVSMEVFYKYDLSITNEFKSSFGMLKYITPNANIFYQNGEHWGHSSSLLLCPYKKTGIVAITNRGSSGKLMSYITQCINRYLSFNDANYLKFTFSNNKIVIGKYVSKTNDKIEINEREGILFYSINGGTKHKLFYKGQLSFIMKNDKYKQFILTLDIHKGKVDGIKIGPHFFHVSNQKTNRFPSSKFKNITGIYKSKSMGKIVLFERNKELILAYSILKEARLSKLENNAFIQIDGPFKNELIHIENDDNRLKIGMHTYLKTSEKY